MHRGADRSICSTGRAPQDCSRRKCTVNATESNRMKTFRRLRHDDSRC